MAKLGFWNRIALTVTAIVTIGLPTYAIINKYNGHSDYRYAVFDDCMQGAAAYTSNDGLILEHEKECWNKSEPFDLDKWMSEFPFLVIFLLLMCALVYLAIWLVVAVFKWIARGRLAD